MWFFTIFVVNTNMETKIIKDEKDLFISCSYCADYERM